MDVIPDQSTAPRIHNRGIKNQLGVPLPLNNEREEDHLRHCRQCQAIWPAYYSQQLIEYHLSFNEISDSWCRIAEHKRLRLYSSLLKWQHKFFKHTKSKPSARQVFFDLNQHRFDEDYATRRGLCNAQFTSLSDTEKSYFNALSLHDRWLTDSNTPMYLKRQYRLYKEHAYKSTLKRPCGAYHEYLNEQKQLHPELTKLSSVQLAKQCRQGYRNLSPEQVQHYKDLYHQHLEEFKKQDLLHRIQFQEIRQSNFITSQDAFDSTDEEDQ
jgi:hypothetical protein